MNDDSSFSSQESLTDEIFKAPPLSSPITKAIYTSCPLYGDQMNPFIDALGPILNRKEIVKAIRERPYYSEAHRQGSPEDRRLFTNNLWSFVIPFDDHMLLYEKLSEMLRYGYLGRNFLDPKYIRELYEELSPERLKEILKRSNLHLEIRPPGLACIGVSGVGKTTGVTRALSCCYPEIIWHERYKEKPFFRPQVVWMVIESPFNASPRALLLEFFKKVDRLLGTNCTKRVKDLSALEMLWPMACVAVNIGLGILVLDEIQRLQPKKSGGGEEWLLEFFVQLSNTLKVPLVVIGTPKVLPLLESEFAISRRLSSGGYHPFYPLSWGRKWDKFATEMWRYQYTRIKTALTPELSLKLFHLSLGIPSLAVEIYRFAQRYAIGRKNESLTPELFELVVKREGSLTKKFVDAIQEDNFKFLKNVSDIPPEFLPINPEKTTSKCSEESCDEPNSTIMKEEISELDDNLFEDLTAEEK